MSKPWTSEIALGSIEEAIGGLEEAQARIAGNLKALEGPERSEGVRMAVEAMGASEVARALGVSRQRVYQLMNGGSDA